MHVIDFPLNQQKQEAVKGRNEPSNNRNLATANIANNSVVVMSKNKKGAKAAAEDTSWDEGLISVAVDDVSNWYRV